MAASCIHPAWRAPNPCTTQRFSLSGGVAKLVPMRAVLALCLVCLTSCQGLEVSGDQRAHDRRVVVDAYLIAHGMARSYAGSEGAVPERVAELRELDRQAALAVHVMLGEPDATPDVAAAQVAALTSLVAGRTP